MPARGRTIAAGAFYGAFASIAIASGIIRSFIAPRPPSVLDTILIAAFASGPWGLLAGAAAGAFLYWRAQRVSGFGRLVAEMSVIAGAIALAVSQRLLPIAWGLPRLKIGVFSVVVAVALAALGTRILKPLYWRRREASNRMVAVS